MNWLWLNISVGAVFFLVIAGVPLWMVIRYPDCRPVRMGATGTGATGTGATGTGATGTGATGTGATGTRTRAQRGTVAVAGMTGRAAVPAEIYDRRELAGASAGNRG